MAPTTNTLAAAEDALNALLAGALPSSSRTKRRKSRTAAAVSTTVVDEAARIRALKAASKVRQKELEVRDRILSMREEKARGSRNGRKRKALEAVDDSDDSD